MVTHESLIKALRSLDFSYKTRSDRVEMYKQKGSTKRVQVRRNVMHEEDYARVVLRQAGMDHEAIESFIGSARTGKH